MEHIDRTIVRRFDTRSSRPCEFCQDRDPHFRKRSPLDQVIASSRQASASAHITEDGYVKHRMLELAHMNSGELAVA